MPSATQLLPEHNHACERARLSSCNCFCHGAGHQHDLIKRAVSCTSSGVNNIGQLQDDLHGIYGGFHSDLRDSSSASRRRVPEDLTQLDLNRGRGATWVETLTVDEALHAAFVGVARISVASSDSDRERRKEFVIQLAEGALRVVGGDVESHNICDGHLWCSVLAEANAAIEQNSTLGSAQVSPYGRIAYPRNRQARIPRALASVRADGLDHARSLIASSSSLPGINEIVKLVGAATCPDLWHHPAAVRYSLVPFIDSSWWVPANTTTLAIRSQLDVLKQRWDMRGHW
jgi:hypothetical protein